MSLDVEDKELCNLANKWISSLTFLNCDCQKKSNCTHLPEYDLYCKLQEATRKNCPDNCQSCPITGRHFGTIKPEVIIKFTRFRNRFNDICNDVKH